MAKVLTALTRSIGRPYYVTISLRCLKTSSPKMDKALENLKTNPYYEKYAARIADLQKTSPEEFMQRVELQQQSKEEEKKKKFASVDTRQFSSVLNPKQALEEVSDANEKKLSDIFKIELVKDKDAKEIQQIWEEYHKSKEVHKENAPECLTIVHYTELADKGLILMRGEFDKNVLDGQEAQCLANQFQMYYSGKDSTKLQLLNTFTKNPDTFKHMDLIAQLENIGL
ncbi:hypothetical protein HF086_013926 [Spodoptera exigua]|uniref:Uncharacterized protein n=1 Tax=Spodoptera exigua TaxID=7107 RepID=A0A922MIN1_SPOEX|nr:hypothetical protein HF086_013926 [Spodoptera exigua]